jgi:hypothetical protein
MLLGMYDGEPYGDEIEGGEDRNDGLNALVRRVISFITNLELAICSRFQQGYRPGSAQLDN